MHSRQAKELTVPVGAAWRRNMVLFVATVASVFITYALNDPAPLLSAQAVRNAGQYTATLLTILLAHEFGHYAAARLHRVDASLPYFIPMPLLSIFGTMGAVIRMRGTIPTRKALLDIGASGPLAGMVVAVPLYLYGVAHSVPVHVDALDSMQQLGEPLLIRALDAIAAPKLREGSDLLYSPVAFGAWAAMLVTWLNLIPIGQLDGGHTAYALFGPKQNRYARIVHRSVLAFFFVSLTGYLLRDVRAGVGFARFGVHVNNSLFWLIWFEVLAVLATVTAARNPRADDVPTLGIMPRVVGVLGLAVVAGVGRNRSSPSLWIGWLLGLALLLAMEVRWGALRAHATLDHPPTGAAPLDRVRMAIAIVTLALFALLFMPSPISM